MSEPTTTNLNAEEDLGLVSIVVPVYKVEAFLDECVSSILSQTYPNIEVILVDDGSPDGCGAICDGWAARDDRVRVVHQENAGLSAARNSGVGVARGDWFMFVDSDDYVGPDFCRRPLELALEHDA
ncbi:MAG: glycosyltransferase, partial [Atopobiaceae bacterium]|nr:glycosyltransferase [Atopobiaceae bacterium]